MAVVFAWSKPKATMDVITTGVAQTISPVTTGPVTSVVMDVITTGVAETISFGDPELPIELVTTRPAHWDAAADHTPANLAALQALVDDFGGTLSAGDVIELDKDTTYSGRLIIPPECKGTAGNEIIFRTSGYASLPAAGTRVAESDSQYMPTMQGVVGVDSVTKRVLDVQCSQDSSGGGSYLRFIGLDITTVAAAQTNYANMVIIGSQDNGGYTYLVADLPKNIIFDQCLVHGNTSTNFGNGILMECAEGGVIDSRIYEVHRTTEDGGVAWRTNGGAGPFMIRNNFLEASGIPIIISDQFEHITQPSDIVIRQNHMTKDEAWDGVWTSKNIFETKWLNRLLFEQNVLSNCSWSSQTSGDAIYLKCSGVVGGTTHTVSNVTCRWNVAYNNEAALSIQNADDAGAGGISLVLIHDNLFFDTGQFGTWNASRGIGYQDIVIRHNTFVIDNSFGNGRHPNLSQSADCGNMTIIDNIIDCAVNQYFRRDSFAQGTPSMNAAFTGPYSYTYNLMTGSTGSSHNTGAEAGSTAANNLFPANQAAIGFSVTPPVTIGNHALDGGSAYINSSSTGGAPGCDIATLLTKIAGVE